MTLKEKEVHAAKMRMENAGERLTAARWLPHGPARAERIRAIWTQVHADKQSIEDWKQNQRTTKLSRVKES